MIYICYHKDAPIVENEIMKPIQVGSAFSSQRLNILQDDKGISISQKNKHYCELTATDWIWKNSRENIVGLCHYRRFFNFKNNETKIFNLASDFCNKFNLNKQILDDLMNKYDLILPLKKSSKKHPMSLYKFYAQEHIKSDMDVLLDVIKEKYPKQYKTAYNTLHESISGYYANMIIAKKKIFNDYAKWLFDILFEVEKRIESDVLKRDSYQQRVYGFLSERLMTVYVALHPKLKIKEVPVIFVEENKAKWRKYLLHQWIKKIFNFNKEKIHD